jgi:hypothetical protein
VLELLSRKLCELDGLVELRRMHARPILGNSVDTVRQLRFREVPIFNRSGVVLELLSGSLRRYFEFGFISLHGILQSGIIFFCECGFVHGMRCGPLLRRWFRRMQYLRQGLVFGC